MRLPTRLIVPVVAAFAVLAAACTGGGTTSSTSTPTSEPTAPPTIDQGDVAFAPGEFAYSLHGVKAQLTWNGGTGELTVTNNSGEQLGPVALYAVTHEGKRVDWTSEADGPIADGGSYSTQVRFPAALEPKDVGIFALEFGAENWGAFAPVPVASASPSA